MNRHTSRGFTLIEVIIALFVVALGIGSLLATLVSSADAIGRLRDKSLAEWIALNHISEVRLAGRKPTVGVTTGKLDYGGRPWVWRQTVADPGIAGMLRIDVSVAAADTPAAQEAAGELTAAAMEQFPAIATAYGFIGTAVASATGIDPDWSLAAAARASGGGDGTGTGPGTGRKPGAGTP